MQGQYVVCRSDLHHAAEQSVQSKEEEELSFLKAELDCCSWEGGSSSLFLKQ